VLEQHLKRAGTTRADIFAQMRYHGYMKAANKFGMTERADKPTGAADVFFLPDGWRAPRLYLAYRKLMQGEDDE
jgi:hypothetical protein